MCTLYSFFSFRPRAVGHIVQPWDCHIIEHIFVPTLSVERNIEKIRSLWVSNSKFVNFPQIFPCSNYNIFPNIPPLAMVFWWILCSNYGGFFFYCPMYTLCIGESLGGPLTVTRRRRSWLKLFFGIFGVFALSENLSWRLFITACDMSTGSDEDTFDLIFFFFVICNFCIL